MKMPQPFWAVILAGLGAVLAVIFYIFPGDTTTRQTAFGIASSLVSGALGAFAGANHVTATPTHPAPPEQQKEQ